MLFGPLKFDISPHFGKSGSAVEQESDGKEGSQLSQHPSLKAASRIKTRRNVLKRFERIEILRQRGQWKEGDRATGLPKTKH